MVKVIDEEINEPYKLILCEDVFVQDPVNPIKEVQERSVEIVKEEAKEITI